MAAAEQLLGYLSAPTDELILLISPQGLALSMLNQGVLIGWAFVLGAAIDNRRRSVALGAGVMTALPALTLLRMVVFPVTAGTEYPWLNTFALALLVVAWIALIVAALTEFGPRSADAGEAAGEAEALG